MSFADERHDVIKLFISVVRCFYLHKYGIFSPSPYILYILNASYHTADILLLLKKKIPAGCWTCANLVGTTTNQSSQKARWTWHLNAFIYYNFSHLGSHHSSPCVSFLTKCIDPVRAKLTFKKRSIIWPGKPRLFCRPHFSSFDESVVMLCFNIGKYLFKIRFIWDSKYKQPWDISPAISNSGMKIS